MRSLTAPSTPPSRFGKGAGGLGNHLSKARTPPRRDSHPDLDRYGANLVFAPTALSQGKLHPDLDISGPCKLSCLPAPGVGQINLLPYSNGALVACAPRKDSDAVKKGTGGPPAPFSFLCLDKRIIRLGQIARRFHGIGMLPVGTIGSLFIQELHPPGLNLV